MQTKSNKISLSTVLAALYIIIRQVTGNKVQMNSNPNYSVLIRISSGLRSQDEGNRKGLLQLNGTISYQNVLAR